MRRFFTNQTLTVDNKIELCDSSFHHWVKVLRARVGDTAQLFDGAGGEYRATLTEISKKTAKVKLDSFNPINRNNPYKVTIAIVMSKGDRMDYAIQKSTEMGAHTIQLLTSERCEVRLTNERLQKKLKSWRAIAISACEQSGLNIVPTVHAPTSLKDYVKQNTASLKLVLAPKQTVNDRTEPTNNVTSDVTSDKSSTEPDIRLPFKGMDLSEITVLIGAEGGLTDDEIEFANQNGFLSWNLGERVLRTETAPITALSHIQAYHLINTI